MVDGAVALMGMMFALRADGYFRDAPGENTFAGGAPFYDTYETKDRKYISIGSLEPQFYSLLLDKLGLTDAPELQGLGVVSVGDAAARARWPALREALQRAFKTRTREEWRQRLEGTDVCFAPVLTFEEAALHPHNIARRTFIEVGGITQNAPAPRFSRTPAAAPTPGHAAGTDTEAVLLEAGISRARIQALRTTGVLG
jgi:alpha-methylacyl-CoA racemase